MDSWEVAEEWQNEKKRVLSTIIPKRTKALINHIEEYGLTDPHKQIKIKVDSKKSLLKLKNPNKNYTLYYMTDGSDPRTVGGEVWSTAMKYKVDIILAHGENVVFYRVKTKLGDKVVWSASCPTYISIK